MAWIESHQEIGLHPKTRKAARIAGVTVPAVVGHLHLIWHWALDFAQDGDISAFEPWQIEDAAMWDGAERTLFGALCSAGYIDCKDGSTVLHDWYVYAGKLIERRRIDAARKRGTSANTPPKPAGISDDIQRTSDGTPPEGAENPLVTVTLTVPSNDIAQDEPDDDAPDGAGARSGLTMLDGGKPPTLTEIRFDRFWQAYPKKRNKQAAFRMWQRIKANDDLTAQIIASLEYQKVNNRDWKKEQGQYIPYPASWLHDGGWEDEDGIELAATGTTPAHWSIPDL